MTDLAATALIVVLVSANAEWKVVNGPTQSMMLGEMPAISRITSTRIVPMNRLTG